MRGILYTLQKGAGDHCVVLEKTTINSRAQNINACRWHKGFQGARDYKVVTLFEFSVRKVGDTLFSRPQYRNATKHHLPLRRFRNLQRPAQSSWNLPNDSDPVDTVQNPHNLSGQIYKRHVAHNFLVGSSFFPSAVTVHFLKTLSNIKQFLHLTKSPNFLDFQHTLIVCYSIQLVCVGKGGLY